MDKPEAGEEYPFGPDVCVFKIHKKIFAILIEEKGIARINLKCDPQEALILRDIFKSIIPGYHMNKQHWNTIICDGSAPRKKIEEWIDNSYHLVVSSLTKKLKRELENL